MTGIKLNPQVDAFIAREKRWPTEVIELRRIALASGLTEDLKWGVPCYTLNGSNVVILHTFKEYCAYLFFKGALMKDEAHLLIQQTENVQAMRQVRFTSLDQIMELEPMLNAYIQEAIAIEKSGAKVNMKDTSEFKVPEEFEQALDADAKLKTAFQSLTPGRQRAYLLFFGAPKQVKTRLERIEKYRPVILAGKGLND
jgi:uncharacterized protein YdeI (YjbR/CyaY-like superfamily)